MDSHQVKVVLAGGGTAGHTTPLKAIASELKKINPNITIVLITGRGDQATQNLAKSHPELFDETYTIFAGKFRRYSNYSLIKQVLDIKQHLLNLRDIIYFGIGYLQSLVILKTIKPQLLFSKGGYVGLPPSLAAASLKIPYIVHDSDATPGLANKIASKWARAILTGMPIKYYSYPKQKMRHLGVPVDSRFKPISKQEQMKLKEKLNLDPNMPVILVTGGSLGAKFINQQVVRILPRVLKVAQVVHITGKENYQEVEKARKLLSSEIRSRYKVIDYVSNNMPDYVRAADIIITRGGASTIAEVAASHKPAIIIPNPYLTDSHQLKNAQIFASKRAALVLSESSLVSDPKQLHRAIESLLNNKDLLKELEQGMALVSNPESAKKIAKLIYSLVQKQGYEQQKTN